MTRAALIAGIVLLALIWLGPLPALARESFSMHMVMHVGVIAISAPLIALGAAPALVRTFGTTIATRAGGAAILASIAEFLVVWGWHSSALHAFSRIGPAYLALEQGSFLLVGLAVWLTALITALPGDERRAPAPAGALAGIGALLFTSMHMTLLGALLGLAPRVLYRHMHGAGPFGLTPLEDQHVGAMVMLGVGGLAYLIGGLALAARLLAYRPAGSLASSRRVP